MTWLDQRHFLSVDHDGQRIRTWNIHRQDVISEFTSATDKLKSLRAHPINGNGRQRQAYLLVGTSTTARNLLIFESNQPTDEARDAPPPPPS